MEEFRAGRSGNEILASALERSASEGIVATVYTHPLGFHGHGAGTTIGLWDQQGGVPGRGDYPLHARTAHSIELNAALEVPEWGGRDRPVHARRGRLLRRRGLPVHGRTADGVPPGPVTRREETGQRRAARAAGFGAAASFGGLVLWLNAFQGPLALEPLLPSASVPRHRRRPRDRTSLRSLHLSRVPPDERAPGRARARGLRREPARRGQLERVPALRARADRVLRRARDGDPPLPHLSRLPPPRLDALRPGAASHARERRREPAGPSSRRRRHGS